MLEPWRQGKVIRIQEETPNTRRFWIEITGTERFDFRPGQFVTLDLPISEQKSKRLRSYSIASSPDGTNIIELVIVRLDGGPGTEFLFNQVDTGTELTLRGPLGVFQLPEPLDKDLFLICTGTGIAPFRSMIRHIAAHNLPHRKIYLIFGCRYRKDALYSEEMRRFEETLPRFRYIPVYSREEPGPLRTGYVHSVYEEILEREKPDALFYLCGWKEMIAEAKQRIQALGYDKKAIHQELYG